MEYGTPRPRAYAHVMVRLYDAGRKCQFRFEREIRGLVPAISQRSTADYWRSGGVAKNARNSRKVSSGASSARKWPDGSDFPRTSTATAPQSRIGSNIRLTTPLSPHN